MKELNEVFASIKRLMSTADEHARMVLVDAAQTIVIGMKERDKSINFSEIMDDLCEPVAA